MKEFVELVAKMRQAQKEYFKTRTANWLLESKRYEKEVDRKIEEFEIEHEAELVGVYSLFGSDNITENLMNQLEDDIKAFEKAADDFIKKIKDYDKGRTDL